MYKKYVLCCRMDMAVFFCFALLYSTHFDSFQFQLLYGYVCLTRTRMKKSISVEQRVVVLWHGADAPVKNGNTKSIQCKFHSSKFNNKTHQ